MLQYYFILQFGVPVLSLGILSVDSCMPLSMEVFKVLSTFLHSSNTKCSRFTMCISFSGSRISHFSKTLGFLLEDGIRSQDLGVKMCLLLQVYYCFKAFPADETMKLSCVYYPVIHICVTLSIGSHLIYTRLNMSSYSCLHF